MIPVDHEKQHGLCNSFRNKPRNIEVVPRKEATLDAATAVSTRNRKSATFVAEASLQLISDYTVWFTPFSP